MSQTEFTNQFMQDKIMYDSLSQAIRLAKENDLEEKDIRALLATKRDLKTKYANNVSEALSRMSLSQNVLPLGGSWYGIRYISDKGEMSLEIEILNSKDLHVVQRDGRHERELNRKELNTFTPGIINESELEMYKQTIRSKAHALLLEQTGIAFNVEVGESELLVQEDYELEQPVNVSAHAGVRYVQRVLKLWTNNDAKAEQYRKDTANEINGAILDIYNRATQVWESDDGFTYHYEEDSNLMFVKGSMSGKPNIVTLYPEEFGFNTDINRLIVKEQLDVMATAYDELLEAEDTYEKVSGDAERHIEDINNEISLLEAKVGALVAKRAVINAEQEQQSKQVASAKAKYTLEFNKLFKKWDT